MNHNVHKLAACSVALSALVVGCTPVAQSQRPVALSAGNSKAQQSAAQFSSQAQAAAKAGKLAEALKLAEQAVESSPRDVGYRMLLGDLYLKNGRFASAETSFSDVVTLDPGNVRATLSLALALIAQGKTLLATTELDKLEGQAAPGDLGLAYALAGEHGRARTLLESAASAPGATGRVRQNLALAYALAGDWQSARTTAAQDVSGAELAERMSHWATLAQPANSYTQVATLLGVTPVADAGQPVRLALASPEPSAVALAEATPAPVPAPVQAVFAPTVVAAATPAPVPAPVAKPAPVAVLPTKIVPVAPADLPVQFAAAAEDLVKASPWVIKASTSVEAAPLAALKPARIAKFEHSSPQRATGRFVVQIGAYRSLSQASRAWAEATRRYRLGQGLQPLSTTVTLPGRGTFHRLSVAPFEAVGQAARACQSIRTRGGACFVRSVAGDAPLQYAMRNSRRG